MSRLRTMKSWKRVKSIEAYKFSMKKVFEQKIVSKVNPTYYKLLPIKQIPLTCFGRCFYTGILFNHFNELPDTYDEYMEFFDNNVVIPNQCLYNEKDGPTEAFDYTADHLCAELFFEPAIYNAKHMTVPCLYFLNRMIGHIPLEMRILHRRHYQKLDFDRNNASKETQHFIYEHKILSEDIYKIGDHYPWQPQAYDENSSERKYAVEFSKKCREVEEYFLNLSMLDKYKFIEEHDVKWEIKSC